MKQSFTLNPAKWLANNRQKRLSESKSIDGGAFNGSLFSDGDFSRLYKGPFNDPCLSNAWVNIAVSILIRNVARADFVVEKDGVELKNGPLFSLFRRPNEQLSRYDAKGGKH